MANNIDFILRLQDLLTPQMRQATRLNQTATNQIASQFATVQQSGARLGGSINELRTRLDGLNAIRFSTTYVREFDTATRAARQLERQIDQLENRGRGGGIGSMLMRGFAGLGIAAAAQEFITSSLGQAAMKENQEIAFKVLTGSKSAGGKMYNDIVKMADVTPFESQDLARGAKTMLGYGVDKNAIMPNLKMLGEVASAQDNPAEALQSLSLAFGQVQAKGHLAGQEVLQMINAGFNPLKEISVMTGRNMNDLEKIMEKGGISAGMLSKAFAHATGEGGKFHNMMLEQSQTLGGQWSTFMDLIHSKMRDFGAMLSPMAKQLMSFASAMMGAANPSAAEQFLQQTSHLRELRLELSLANISNARRKEIFDELKSNYPDVLKNINNEKDALTKLLPALDAYNNKRYLAGAQMQLKERYLGGLTAYQSAMDTKQIDYERGRSLLFDFAAKHNLPVQGMDEQGAQKYILNHLQSLAASGKGTKIGNTHYTEESRALTSYRFLMHDYKKQNEIINQNQAAVIGFNKADELQNKIMGITAPSSGAATGKDGGNVGATGDDLGLGGKASAINAGGQKVITINIAKQIEKLEVHVANAREGAQEIAAMIREETRKIMYSLNGETAN